jgi:hypothetical protein
LLQPWLFEDLSSPGIDFLSHLGRVFHKQPFQQRPGDRFRT